jgi:hypothetical protein
MTDRRILTITGGAAGILGTCCYITVAAISLGPALSFALAMLWPILSIIFAFSFHQYVSITKQSGWNHLALLFTTLAFLLVAAMLSIQLGVETGMEESLSKAAEADRNSLKTLSSALRLVDSGLDVAWDMFIGTGLIFLSVVLKYHEKFGMWWAIPLLLLAVMLLVLNVITFPAPPNTAGLFDVGPFIGVYIILLSTRLFVLGLKEDAG